MSGERSKEILVGFVAFANANWQDSVANVFACHYGEDVMTVGARSADVALVAIHTLRRNIVEGVTSHIPRALVVDSHLPDSEGFPLDHTGEAARRVIDAGHELNVSLAAVGLSRMAIVGCVERLGFLLDRREPIRAHGEISTTMSAVFPLDLQKMLATLDSSDYGA